MAGLAKSLSSERSVSAAVAAGCWLLRANPRIHRLVFFNPLGIAIRHEIQSDVMLEKRFEAR
jgi:hypothetical protein